MQQVVSAGMCDPSGRLSLIGALSLIQDVVTATMAELKLDGFTVRREYNALMVFSKNHFRFLQSINWQDKIKVECFVSSKSLARMNIDVCIKKQSEIALYARTEVCAVDASTARIRRLDTMDAFKCVQIVRAPYELDWEPMDGTGELVDTVKVRTSNIDYAGHTNNVEYIRLLLDTFTLEEWRGMAPTELQVAYLNQSFLSDELAIYCSNQTPVTVNTHERIYTIKKKEQEILRCLLRW